jgi:prepilin peptidase CpaA
MTHALLSAFLLICPALIIVGGVHDLISYRIPNWISLVLLAAFAVAAAAAFALGVPPSILGLNLAVGFAALLIGFGMFAFGWIGGGDAKLFASGALWIGWTGAATYAAATCIAGGAFSILILAFRSDIGRAYLPANGPAWFARLIEPKAQIPYGVAIAIGALAAFPESSLVKALAAL